jgi:NIPSNAP
MATQLRDYRIREGSLDVFVAAWQAGVRPLREAAGFRILGAWTVASESRFVWLLSLDASWDEFERRDDEYYASPARTAVQPDPRQWIISAEHHRLEPVAGLRS